MKGRVDAYAQVSTDVPRGSPSAVCLTTGVGVIDAITVALIPQGRAIVDPDVDIAAQESQ